MTTRPRHIVFLALIVVLALTMAACTNTWHGAGQDVENMGEEMQNQYR